MAYGDIILAESSLVSYWKLDETAGTSAADGKGGLTGTYAGGYTLDQNPAGTSMTRSTLFNGTSGYVTVPTTAVLHPTTTLSIEAWFKLPALPGAYKDIAGSSYSANSAPFINYALYIDSTNRMVFALGVASIQKIVNGPIPTAGLWYHLIGTYDGTTALLYVNGAVAAGLTFSGAVMNSNQTFEIGRYNRTGVTGEWFNGNISDVALYNTALSAPTALAHYNAAGSPAARVTQVVAEALYQGNPPARTTQAVVEVLRSTAQVQGVVKTLSVVRGLVQSATGGYVDTYDLTLRAVTWPRVQAVNTNKLLGRSSAGSGDVEEITLGTGLSMSGGVLTSSGGVQVGDSPTWTGQHTFVASAAGNTPIKVRAAAGQTANLQEWQSSIGAVLASIDNGGYAIVTGIKTAGSVGGTIFEAGYSTIGTICTAGSAAAVSLTVKGAPSQSARLQEWQNSTGIVVVSMDVGGTFYCSYFAAINNSMSFTATAGYGYQFVGSPTVFYANYNGSVNVSIDNYGYGAPNAIGLVVKGGTGQSVNLQEWRDSTGAGLAAVSKEGYLGIGTAAPAYPLHLSVPTGTAAPIIRIYSNTYGASIDFSTYYGGSLMISKPVDATLTTGWGGSFYGDYTGWYIKSTTGATQAFVEANGRFFIYAGAAGSVGLIVQGKAGQSANLQEWQDSTGAAVAVVTPAGLFTGTVRRQMSIVSDASGLKLENDMTVPGPTRYYGTDVDGTRGYFDLPVSTIEDIWSFSTNTTIADPGTTKFRTDQLAFATSTMLAISSTSNTGIDRTNLLKMLRADDIISVQDKGNSANWMRYRIIATPTNNTTWFQIPIVMIEGGGAAPTNNSQVVFTFTQSGGGVGYTDEQAQDAAAAMILGGTHTGISFAYNDVANTLSATATGSAFPTDGIAGGTYP